MFIHTCGRTTSFFICIHLWLPGFREYALDEILRRDALIFHHAANGFSQHARHGEFLHLRTVATIWNAVGEHHFFQGRSLNTLIGRARHDAVAGDGTHALCATAHDEVGSLCDGAGRVNNIVNEHNVHASNVANDLHFSHFVGFLAALVAHDHRTSEILCIRGCTL